MPVRLERSKSSDYFLAHYTHQINEDELVSSYKKFLGENDSLNFFRELCDMSYCDMSEITLSGLKELSELISEYCKRNRIESAKCACYSPRSINHSLMELYSAASKDSVETTRVFQDKEEAIRWLLE